MIHRLSSIVCLSALFLGSALSSVNPVSADDVDPLDRELLDALEGQPPTDSLEQIIPRLIDGTNTAAQRIGQGQLDDETAALQKQILADIDALLKHSAPPSQPSLSQQPTHTPSQQDQRSQDAQSQQQPSQQDSQNQPDGRNDPNASSRESEERSAHGDGADSERQGRLDLSTAAWGHLPPKVREQMRSAFSEEYLPAYDALVRRYYEALARRRAEDRDRRNAE